jgi:hypothetical protein
MYDAYGSRRKLIVFSEHRDTLNYLVRKLQAMLGLRPATEEIGLLAPEISVNLHWRPYFDRGEVPA